MAKVELQKVHVTGLRNHYDTLVKELQRHGLMHIKSNPGFAAASTEVSPTTLADDFDVAKVKKR